MHKNSPPGGGLSISDLETWICYGVGVGTEWQGQFGSSKGQAGVQVGGIVELGVSDGSGVFVAGTEVAEGTAVGGRIGVLVAGGGSVAVGGSGVAVGGIGVLDAVGVIDGV